jgi:hypothetical protein
MLLQILLLLSLALNVALMLAFRRRTPVRGHEHTWTSWTDFRTLEPPPFTYGVKVIFRRVRYCSACGEEQKQEVGEHPCEAVSIKGKRCPHFQDYTEIFDPLYELKQIDREIKRLEGL